MSLTETIQDKQVWFALEDLAKKDKRINLSDWMFMGTFYPSKGYRIHLYKHSDTRRYLNLDDDGNFYHYAPNSTPTGEYIKTKDIEMAIVFALSMG